MAVVSGLQPPDGHGRDATMRAPSGSAPWQREAQRRSQGRYPFCLEGLTRPCVWGTLLPRPGCFLLGRVAASRRCGTSSSSVFSLAPPSAARPGAAPGWGCFLLGRVTASRHGRPETSNASMRPRRGPYPVILDCSMVRRGHGTQGLCRELAFSLASLHTLEDLVPVGRYYEAPGRACLVFRTFR